MRLEAMAVKIPHVEGHPNRVPFEGVLTVVNSPSDKAPAGARGHRVMSDAGGSRKGTAFAAGHGRGLPSGMGRARCAAQDRHVDRGELVGQAAGGAWISVRARLSRSGQGNGGAGAGAMGMSYELADARVEDMRAEIWKLTRVTFTGAAILLREKAAYRAQASGWQVSKRQFT